MTLFLSDVAGSEILLILIVVLMFFGSKSIPGIARTFGRTIRQIKDASQDLQNEIKQSGVDIKKDLNLEGLLDRTTREIEAPVEKISSEITNQINNTISYNKSNFFVNQQQSPALDEDQETEVDQPDSEMKADDAQKMDKQKEQD